MKICFVTNGGITRHATMKRAYAMAPALLARSHEVTVVVEDAADNADAAAKIPGIQIASYPAGQGAMATRNAKEMRVAAARPDIVHVCGLGWRNAVRPARLNSRLVIMDHVEIESTLLDSPWSRRWLQARLEHWSLGAYDAHIGASRYLEAWLRQHCFKRGLQRPLLWLPYANDYAGLEVDPASSAAVRAKFPGKKILFYFGSFYRHYGFWTMLESARELSRSRSDFVLVLAGRGPAKTAGEEFIKAHGLGHLVHFSGYLGETDAIAHLQAAHACIVPLFDTETDWARCPGKLFISMNSNRPIITAAVGEAREYFLSGDFHYDARRPETMAAVLGRALEVPAAWAPNYERSAHTWAQRTDRWLEWVEAQLAGKGKDHA